MNRLLLAISAILIAFLTLSCDSENKKETTDSDKKSDIDTIFDEDITITEDADIITSEDEDIITEDIDTIQDFDDTTDSDTEEIDSDNNDSEQTYDEDNDDSEADEDNDTINTEEENDFETEDNDTTAECQDSETQNIPCGLNNKGNQLQICTEGNWIDSGTCNDPAFTETEPNNSIVNATIVIPGNYVSASLTVGDYDVYQLNLENPATISVIADDGFGGCSGDTRLTQISAEIAVTMGVNQAILPENRLDYNDDYAPVCSALMHKNFAAGSYYFVIEDYGRDNEYSYFIGFIQE